MSAHVLKFCVPSSTTLTLKCKRNPVRTRCERESQSNPIVVLSLQENDLCYRAVRRLHAPHHLVPPHSHIRRMYCRSSHTASTRYSKTSNGSHHSQQQRVEVLTRTVTTILNLQIVQRLPRKLTHSIGFDREFISIEGSLNPVRDLGSARFETGLVAEELKQSAEFLLSLVEKQ